MTQRRAHQNLSGEHNDPASRLGGGQNGSILSFTTHCDFQQTTRPCRPQPLNLRTGRDPAESGHKSTRGSATQYHTLSPLRPRLPRPVPCDAPPDRAPSRTPQYGPPRAPTPGRHVRGGPPAPTCLLLRLHAEVLAQLLHRPVPDILLVGRQPLSELDLGRLHGGGYRVRWSIPRRSPPPQSTRRLAAPVATAQKAMARAAARGLMASQRRRPPLAERSGS